MPTERHLKRPRLPTKKAIEAQAAVNTIYAQFFRVAPRMVASTALTLVHTEGMLRQDGSHVV